jgi:hypothetical protein
MIIYRKTKQKIQMKQFQLQIELFHFLFQAKVVQLQFDTVYYSIMYKTRNWSQVGLSSINAGTSSFIQNIFTDYNVVPQKKHVRFQIHNKTSMKIDVYGMLRRVV